MKGRRALPGVALAAALAGCAVGPDFKTPASPSATAYTPATLPAQTAAGPEPAQRFAPGSPVTPRWWTELGSARLDALEDEALRANPDLQSARAALTQAREAWLAQRASQLPTVQLDGSALRARNSAAIAPPLSSNAQLYSLYNAQFNVAYVVDVFGGQRRQTEAAAAQADVQHMQTEAAYLTLTANVANAAVQLASLDSQMDDTRRIIEANQRTVDVTRRRQRLGEASTVDVAAAETALEQAALAAPALQRQIDQERDLLAALIGRAPSDAPTDRLVLSDFSLPASLPVSLPADLVRQRPDVRAAEANVHAASALVGVAMAARLPTFTLGASAGGASGNLSTLLAGPNTLWSLTGSASQTVFDAGALRHKQKAAEAALDQAKAQYRGAVLAALQNTADVLQAIVDDADGLTHAARAAQASDHSVKLARDGYDHGQTGALPLLTAQAADAQAQLALTQARAARLIDTIALFQALGGGWSDARPDPAIAPPRAQAAPRSP
jgi:NodT family efflux transporter outer membrane factor (OMF) lipoprotein